MFVVFVETNAWFERVDEQPLTHDDVETLGGVCHTDGVYDHDTLYVFTFDHRGDAERFRSSPSRSSERVDTPGYVFHNVDACGPVETHTDDTLDALLSRGGVSDVYHNATW